MTHLPSIAGLLLSFAFGATVSLSFLVAPLAFRRLPREHAVTFVRALFTPFYLVMIVVTALAAITLLIEFFTGERTGSIWSALANVLLTSGTCVLFVLLRQVVSPALRAARKRDDEGKRAERWYHRFSVVFDLLQMFLLGFVLWRIFAA